MNVRLPLFHYLYAAGDAAAVEAPKWAWYITVRPIRVFVPRVRLPRVEFGHLETTDPAVSD